MLSRLAKACKYFLVLLLLICVKSASAQTKYDAISFRVDSLAAVGLPKSALKEVDKLDKLARDEKNAAQQIRTVIYRATFQSYIEENALAAIIARLKKDITLAQYPARPVMQSILAEMYWNYYKDNRYEFNEGSRLETVGDDYTKWDLQTIISETSRLYNLSLADAKQEQETSIGVLNDVLKGDKKVRYLRPTLYDLLAQRAFEFYLDDEPEIIKPKMAFSLNDTAFFSNAATFSKLPVVTTDTASTWYQGIRLLQQAIAFHLQTPDKEALADLDLQRLKFLKDKSNALQKDSLYVVALSGIAAKFSEKPTSSTALQLLGEYYKQADSLKKAHQYFEKAKTSFPKSAGGLNAAKQLAEIELREISATVEDVNMPGKQILALLSYKNIPSARFSVYRLSDKQIDILHGLTTADWNVQKAGLLEGFSKKLKPVESRLLTLPTPGDYQTHTAEFSINPLPVGSYFIMVEDQPSKGKKVSAIGDFSVSNLTYVIRKMPDGANHVQVLNRVNGAVLPGIQVKVLGRVYDDKKSEYKRMVIASGRSDAKGIFTFRSKESESIILLSTKDDRLINNMGYISGYLEAAESNVEPKAIERATLFTDRQIYRPGQTVYFKALYTSTLKGKSSLKPNEKLEVIILGTQGQRISILNLVTNEFGTVAGSFIIPQNMLGGQLSISTGHGSINVTVDEYKRPTFQAAFLPVKEVYRFNDSVHVKGKVIAFSGYGISDAIVALHVGRGRTVRNPYSRVIDYTGSADAEITTDTIKTNNNGEFNFAFKATPADDVSPDIYNYNITANVTDGSGETQTASQTVKISNQVLNIDVDLPEKLSPGDSTKFALKFSNINDQLQNGSVKVKMSALSPPRALFKTRVWDIPDQFILTKEEFIKQFPNYAWQHEDDKKYWAEAKTVVDKQISLTDSITAILDLGALKNESTGIYKVVINAKNLKGDTVSQTYYISLHNQPANAANTGDWVTALNNKVKKAGESVDFRIGVSSDSRVLVEKYEGARILSAEWITIGGNQQQTIKITVPATAKNNFAVQFLIVNDNRRYQFYEHLSVQDSVVKGLNIRFTTFRNKLQPGQKEQWKLQVSGTGNEKAEAEMLAGMYDASLDDVLPARKLAVNLETGYNYDTPDYFKWQTGDLVSAAPTDALNGDYNWTPDYFIDYETLNWFGLDYQNGSAYNTYIKSVKDHRKALAHDKHINELFIKKAALVKNGYVVSGRVLSSWGVPQADVKISIKGTGISVFSNSIGYYKIKVPYEATLIFAKSLFGKKYVTAPVNGNIFIFWNSVRFPPPILADPGVKSQEGDPNSDLIISESAANAAVAMVEYDAVSPAEDAPQPLANAKRNGYTVNDKVVLREMALKPGQKFDHELLQSSPQLSRQIVPRKNFNETAFFYPQLRTDEKGSVLIEFTIPEALTKWKFRAFAHDKQLRFGYTEANVVTQKQLSINANMPRFLREGDTVTVSARLANLAATALKGKAQLQLFNGINMQPVSLLMNKNEAQQQFEINASTTSAVSFKLVIPPGLEALTYRLTADAGNFTDGEENTIPVLPNRMLVTESMPMMVRAGQNKTFSFDKLINQSSTTLKNKTLTLEYTQNPAWYAVQAMPYMMEFPYECSEQLFSRYYANTLSADLIAKMPVIKQVFDRWKDSDSKELLSNLEKNQELKNTVLEETPWLQDAISQSEQKKRIAQLFDLNKMSYEMKTNLDKLKQKQLPDGSFPWFAGAYADVYITRHVLEGIGQLYHLKIASAYNYTLKDIGDKALGYMDAELLRNDKEAKKQKKYELREVDADEVHAWYVRSYFTDKALSAELKAAFNNYLKRAEDQWVTESIYQQGMIAFTMARNGKLPVAKAIVKSLMETAQQSDDMGMYWGKNLMGYYWYQSPIETQSLMIALFTELGGNDKAIEEMKIWLMRNKQTNNWQTTKATAAAVYALLLKQENWLQATASSEIKIDGRQLLSLKPDLKADAGTGYIKTNWVDEQVKPVYGKVEVKNNGQSISYGALHWQYLEQMDKITPSKTDVSIERKYFIKKQTDAGPVLQEVDASHQPKTGDLLKVVVYLKAGRDYEYVQLKDLRPAGTEPASVLSDYKYQDGLWYYQVTKDVATNFFISRLNKGNYVFEYELRVAQPGNFSTGITSIQCMYAPEFNAHSEGRRVAFKP